MAKSKSVSWHIIALTVTLISLCAFCAPAHAGVSPDDGRAIGDVANGTRAIIGETNLSFVNDTGVLIPSGKLKGTWEDSKPIWFPNEGNVFDSSTAADLVDGEYNVIGDKGKTTTVDFELPTFFQDVPTEVNGYDFEWVTRGGKITLNADTNLHEIRGPKPNNITYNLLDPRGVRVYEVNGVLLYDISVNGNGDNSSTINTTGMRTGTYTLSIETDPDTNNGLDTEGPEKSFEVRSKGVTIVKPDPKIPEERTVTVTESMPFKFETTPKTNVTLDVTWGMPSKVSFKKFIKELYKEKEVAGGQSDKKGNLEINAYFEVTGAFEITATEDIMGTATSIFVESVPYEAELTEPKEEVHYIGVPITIAGKANAGDRVTIKIEDETFDIVERDGDTFEAPEKWQTEDKSPDSYKIAIWVSPFSDPYTDPPDDSVTVVLIRGGLFVDTSADFVALGDEFKIEGIVPGRDRVDIFTIAPDGGGGSGLDPDDISEDTEGNLNAPGLTYETSGVDTDGEFETEKITVGKDVDTGTYLIAALNYGRDGVWGKSGSDDLLGVLSNKLGVKTTEQILAILKDKTINAAGSDDLLGIATIKVENGFVTLDEIEAVPLGKKIAITGTTNRQVDTSIIVTVEGLDETTPKLKPKIAEVKEDPDNFYNSFELEFDTASANIGKYAVTADDGDGHIATTTVTILLTEEPSVNVSTTPAPETEGQEPELGEEAEEPTATPVTPAPAPAQPGFELLPTIVGLLLTVTVLLRSRNRKRR